MDKTRLTFTHSVSKNKEGIRTDKPRFGGLRDTDKPMFGGLEVKTLLANTGLKNKTEAKGGKNKARTEDGENKEDRQGPRQEVH